MQKKYNVAASFSSSLLALLSWFVLLSRMSVQFVVFDFLIAWNDSIVTVSLSYQKSFKSKCYFATFCLCRPHTWYLYLRVKKVSIWFANMTMKKHFWQVFFDRQNVENATPLQFLKCMLKFVKIFWYWQVDIENGLHRCCLLAFEIVKFKWYFSISLHYSPVILYSGLPADQQYGYVISERLGKSTSKEQYAYLYRFDHVYLLSVVRIIYLIYKQKKPCWCSWYCYLWRSWRHLPTWTIQCQVLLERYM